MHQPHFQFSFVYILTIRKYIRFVTLVIAFSSSDISEFTMVEIKSPYTAPWEFTVNQRSQRRFICQGGSLLV